MPRTFTSLIGSVLLLVSLLIVPASSTKAEGEDWQYTVRPGDTLWSVCETYAAFEKCWLELGQYNGISKPRALSIGERLRVPVAWLKQKPVAARVAYVQGQVLLGNKGTQRPLEKDERLKIGHRVVTREGSATLRFADGSLLTMLPNSEIVLDSVSAFRQSRSLSIEVSLPTGEIRVRVPERTPKTRFDVKTPSAVAAVRGTQFRVSADTEEAVTRGEVLEGNVALATTQSEVDVGAGFGALAKQDKPVDSPIQLLDAPQWNLSCTDPGYAEWQSLPGAQYYNLVLLEDDVSQDKILNSRQVKRNYFTFKGLDEKCYQLRISAVDTVGFNGLESQRQFCYELQLEPPVINSAQWADDRLTLSWDSVPGAEHYVVEVSSDQSFRNIDQSVSAAQTETSFSFDRRADPIHVRLSAKAGEKTSLASEEQVLEHSDNHGLLIGILAVIAAFALL